MMSEKEFIEIHYKIMAVNGVFRRMKQTEETQIIIETLACLEDRLTKILINNIDNGKSPFPIR